MKIFNILVIVLSVLGLIGFFYLYSEVHSAETNPNDPQSGIGIAAVFLITLWFFLGAITLMLIDLMVMVFAKKWKDKLSKITLLFTLLCVLAELVALLIVL